MVKFTDCKGRLIGSKTHPCGGIEFSQQEEDMLLTRFEGLVLTAVVAIVRSHYEAEGQLFEARCDVGIPLV